MKKIRHTVAVLAAAAAWAAAGTAQAQQTGFYVGAGVGQSKGTNVDANDVSNFLRDKGYTNPSSTADDRDTSYRLTAGYSLNPAVAVEAIYADIGRFGTRSTVTNGTVSADYKAKGYGVDLVLSAPMSEQFSVFGRVGVLQAKTEADFRSSGVVVLNAGRGSTTKTAQHYGLGLQFNLTKAVALRAEVERFRKLGDDSTGGELQADAYSLGAIFRF
jgi:OOP family OmpA-OmpF porin